MVSIPKVQVTILSRNRPEYTSQAVTSILNQTYPNIHLVVSDNSTNDETYRQLKEDFPEFKFEYVKREPPVSVFPHFNQNIIEINAEYGMLFHDDDLLLPEAIQRMVENLEHDPSLSAVSCNAYVIDSNNNKLRVFCPSLKDNLSINSASELAYLYMKVPMRVVPFSAYLYRTKNLKNTAFLYKEGRKHADVSFLMKIAMQGPILWLSEPLMSYRVHGSNDSGIYDIKAIFSLCRFIRRTTSIPDKDLEKFKVSSLVAWLKYLVKTKKINDASWTSRVLIQYLLKLIFSHPLRFLSLVFKL